MPVKTEIKEPQHIPIPSSYSYNPSLITNSLYAGLSIIGPDMRIVWHNDVDAKWFGPITEVKGRHCYEVYEKKDKICPGCPTIKIFKQNYDHCVAIRRGVLTSNGEKKCFKLTASPIKDNDGKVVQVLELVEDVTEKVASDRKIKARLNIVTKELDFISKLDRQFISFEELSLDEVLKRCVEITQSLLGARMCNLRLLDGTRKTLVSRASSGLNNHHIKKNMTRIGEGLAGRVAAVKRPIIINDIERSRHNGGDEYLMKEEIRSAVCVPILLKDSILGTLSVFERRPAAFTSEDSSLLLCFANHIAILIDNIRTHKEVLSSYIHTIKSLVSAIEVRDSYTRGHSEKVTKFALDIANAMGLSEDDKLLLTYCGRLHDIGKIAIPDSILNKPGPLTVAERSEVQLHPVRAVEILTNLKFIERGIPAIRHHHERFDGRGYPDGLKGKDIPFMARILACADAFDAMISNRAYRPAMKVSEALAELEANRAKQFDPEILDVFVDIVRPRPT